MHLYWYFLTTSQAKLYILTTVYITMLYDVHCFKQSCSTWQFVV